MYRPFSIHIMSWFFVSGFHMDSTCARKLSGVRIIVVKEFVIPDAEDNRCHGYAHNQDNTEIEYRQVKVHFLP